MFFHKFISHRCARSGIFSSLQLLIIKQKSTNDNFEHQFFLSWDNSLTLLVYNCKGHALAALTTKVAYNRSKQKLFHVNQPLRAVQFYRKRISFSKLMCVQQDGLIETCSEKVLWSYTCPLDGKIFLGSRSWRLVCAPRHSSKIFPLFQNIALPLSQ